MISFVLISLIFTFGSCNARLSTSQNKEPNISRLAQRELQLDIFSRPSFFQDNLPLTLNNVLGPILGTAYYWNLDSFLLKLPQIRFLPRYSWSRQPKGLFFHNSNDFYYCSFPLVQLPISIMEQLQQFEQFNTYSKSNQDLHQLSQPHGALWLSSPGVNAAMHFDTSENLLTQIRGNKKIILVHPKYWKELNMFSALHPLSRQSQLPIEDGPWCLFNHHMYHLHKQNEKTNDHEFPLITNYLDIKYETYLLSPGDVLRIPPFYFHSVSISLEENQTSISINNYFHAPHKLILNSIYSLSKNIYNKKNIKNFKQTLEYVFLQLNHDLSKLAFDVLNTRWQTINEFDMFLSGNLTFQTSFSIPPNQTKHHPNNSGDDNSLANKCTYLNELYGNGGSGEESIEMNDLLSKFLTLKNLVPDAFEMLLADYLEIVIAQTIGTQKVKTFLTCL